jgi:hypothetical protein
MLVLGLSCRREGGGKGGGGGQAGWVGGGPPPGGKGMKPGGCRGLVTVLENSSEQLIRPACWDGPHPAACTVLLRITSWHSQSCCLTAAN